MGECCGYKVPPSSMTFVCLDHAPSKAFAFFEDLRLHLCGGDCCGRRNCCAHSVTVKHVLPSEQHAHSMESPRRQGVWWCECHKHGSPVGKFFSVEELLLHLQTAHGANIRKGPVTL